jgi:hypothetical protein
MKKVKIIFLLILAFITVTTVEAKRLDEYYESNYNLVMIADELQQFIREQYNIKDAFKDYYPDFYGGMYINDKGDRIVIQIVKDNIPKKSNDEFQIYNKLINYNDFIEIEYVTNTFNEINDINNKVSDYITSKMKHDSIIGCYIDITTNKVVIEMIDLDESHIIALQKDINRFGVDIVDDIIQYIKAEKPTTYQDIKSGGYIRGKQVGTYTYESCSMGFRTKYSGQFGYVTAGHCINGATNIQSGTVLLAQFANNQNYDYGFVATYSNYSPVNELIHPNNGVETLAVVNYCPIITQNMAVAKSGNVTEYTSGKVTGLNQTATYDVNGVDIVIKGLVKTNLKAQGGDSGAPVFVPRTDTNGGPIPLGVISGGFQGILGIGRRTYFTDISNMPSVLLTNRY